MPTNQEFALIVDQQTITFIRFVVQIFLSLALCLALAFSFVIAVLYCSAKLLTFGYGVMLAIMATIQARKEVLS